MSQTWCASSQSNPTPRALSCIREAFTSAGSEVIVCGRREDALAQAKDEVAGLHTRVCDVAKPEERIALFEWATSTFPRLNMLVNNAGIQRRLQLLEKEEWQRTQQEIAINLEAPIHLCQLFAPHLLQQQRPTILNVTSGLSFVPLFNVPVYCSTKAALHSFTLSLRQQLIKTPVKVVEVIPPAVNTDLGGPGLHTFGEPLDEFADAVIERLQQGELEIAYGSAQKSSRASREELDAIFEQMNQRFS
ncbi:MAG: SDR family NAD(P)-dependent oxidoreductase [Proteobacteria bacterium]|nr:MAG: SDR family NAD(P)-dependent oxidoreductase [Pseudomonadota bacterium]